MPAAHANLHNMQTGRPTWKKLLFYLLLPVFLLMALLGFPMPVAPPPATKAGQEVSVPEKKKKR